MKIALQINGKYFVAENGGDDVGVVHANRTAIGSWETWTLERQDDGRIALKSVNGRYLSAEGGGGGDVHANRRAVGPWEQWRVVQQSDTDISLQSDNGHFLSAQLQTPNVPVNATRTSAGPWETFTVIVLESDTPRVHVEGTNFVDEVGRRWMWRGCTDFLLFKRYLDGEDITPLLRERAGAGANLVRVLSMCENIAHFRPQEHPDYFDRLGPFIDLLSQNALYVELTVFADAQIIMSDSGAQHRHFDRVVDVVRPKPNIFVELVNEFAKNGVDPRQFQQPSGVLASHGSGLTDEDPAEPRWNYAAYHARRDGARGFTNYNPYGFQAVYPQPVPLIPDEGAKPGDYGGDSQFANLMGRHAAIGWGGTFHSQEGVESRPFSPTTLSCAIAFFRGLTTL